MPQREDHTAAADLRDDCRRRGLHIGIIDALLARAVIGRTWTDEDEAIRTAARYLGFRRTGSQIERAFRSAINGGLRQGVLERSGRMLGSASPT